ncbi:hypothetical protein FN846DRAFT_969866 [Sphaerosporella brunnea]|uniref:Uncharacterized protein n=1 Tax=Sphaerosporella brunnea TaxID=1250544 RepID=A0A5J5EJN8_9PEZI|nr:hypothetical protein FN846DRAFT_969866 [Sphaerosporella brunnea]
MCKYPKIAWRRTRLLKVIHARSVGFRPDVLPHSAKMVALRSQSFLQLVSDAHESLSTYESRSLQKPHGLPPAVVVEFGTTHLRYTRSYNFTRTQLFNNIKTIMYFKTFAVLALSAFALADDSAAEKAQIQSALAAYSDIPGVSKMISVYSKYATVSGFAEFNSALADKAMTYMVTQTHLTGIPTATDPAALATDPAMLAVLSDYESLVTAFAATETYMTGAAKSSFAADLKSALAADATATAHSTKTTGGVAVQSANPAPALKAGLAGAVAAAGVAAVALL